MPASAPLSVRPDTCTSLAVPIVFESKAPAALVFSRVTASAPTTPTRAAELVVSPATVVAS